MLYDLRLDFDLMVSDTITTLNLLYLRLTLKHLGGVSDLAQMCGTDGIRTAGRGHVELWSLLLSASTGLDHLSRHAGLCLKELWKRDREKGNKQWRFEGMRRLERRQKGGRVTQHCLLDMFTKRKEVQRNVPLCQGPGDISHPHFPIFNFVFDPLWNEVLFSLRHQREQRREKKNWEQHPILRAVKSFHCYCKSGLHSWARVISLADPFCLPHSLPISLSLALSRFLHSQWTNNKLWKTVSSVFWIMVQFCFAVSCISLSSSGLRHRHGTELFFSLM